MYINPLLCYFLEPDAHCTLKLHKMQTTPPQTAHKGAQYSGKQHKWAERATTRANIGLKTLTPSIGVLALTTRQLLPKGFTSGLTITTPHSRSMPGGRSLSPGKTIQRFPRKEMLQARPVWNSRYCYHTMQQRNGGGSSLFLHILGEKLCGRLEPS